MNHDKQMIVVGGPNGSGKTTFVHEVLASRRTEYIGADAIAAEICPEKPESVAVEAGREFIRRLNDRIISGQNIVVESTLSGKSLINYIDRAAEAGFETALNFVFLNSADACVARVAHRVRRGGHHVPEEDVRRRYQRSLKNFWNHYRFSVDNWMLYINSTEAYLDVAAGEADNYEVVNLEFMQLFLSEVEE